MAMDRARLAAMFAAMRERGEGAAGSAARGLRGAQRTGTKYAKRGYKAAKGYVKPALRMAGQGARAAGKFARTGRKQVGRMASKGAGYAQRFARTGSKFVRKNPRTSAAVGGIGLAAGAGAAFLRHRRSRSSLGG